jgi:cytochrome c biogenesis protein CcmG, thiol:disulfide interchange protein DsbE
VKSAGRTAVMTGVALVGVMALLTLGIGLRRHIAKVGDALPAISLPQLSGANVDLTVLRGKPVILNFFTTWCKPCQEEAPVLQNLAAQGIGKYTVVMIDRGDSANQVAEFVQQYHLSSVLVVRDSDDTWAAKLLVTGQPETFYIDSNGVIRKHINHELAPSDLGTLTAS